MKKHAEWKHKCAVIKIQSLGNSSLKAWVLQQNNYKEKKEVEGKLVD